jgi:hypothetical protein
VPLVAGRPLLVVDADEVLVHLAAHLARFVDTLGYDMNLTVYRLEGALRHRETDTLVDFAGAIALINRFFEEETLAQQPIDGAAEALSLLARSAQVVVLTNVPRHGREARIENLGALGMAYPLVENTGGKGRALAWLADRVDGAPVAFVDDSPNQIESAARRAPQVTRLHFVGAEYVADLIPHCPDANHRVASWAEAEAILRTCLRLGEG